MPDLPQPLRRADRRLREDPPGPFRRSFFRSPVRGPWLTSTFSLALLVGVPLVFVTGLLSQVAWNAHLGGTNNQTPDAGFLEFFLFWQWPRNNWAYRLNQGVHLLVGIALLPIVLAKLWSVMPTLFKWPPAKNPGVAVERLSHVFLIGGFFFQTFTGLLFIQNYVVFTDHFNQLHFYGGWVFMAAFVVHAAVKAPGFLDGFRDLSLREVLISPVYRTRPEPLDPDGMVTTDPAPPTISRRGVLGLTFGTAAAAVLAAAPQTFGERWRWLAVLSPRAQPMGDDGLFQVNKTFARAGIDPGAIGEGWRLHLDGPAPRSFSRDELLAMPLHRASLPINCLEGWSTGYQHWEGLRLRDLAALAGMPDPAMLQIHSLEPEGRTTESRFPAGHVLDARSLLALRVNGVDLPLDHGYPARVITPGSVGNRNLKWVDRLTFHAEVPDDR